MTLNANKVRRSALGGLLLATLLAAGCGGGTTENNYQPARIVALGDESSLIVDAAGTGNGLKYSVNGTVSATDATVECLNNLLWTQVVANNFGGLRFPQCNHGAAAAATAPNRIRATLGARVADLAAQIDAQNAETPISSNDLFTVMVGVNDVLAQYAQYPTLSEAQITANLEAAGAEYGRQVNRLADLNARVVVSTIADVGYSPYAIAQKAANTDIDRQALIIRLVAAYNRSMRFTIYNDGRRIGLVLMDEYVQSVARFVGLNGFSNATTGVCDLTKSTQVPPSVLDCTALTLIAGGSPTAFLWADDRHLSYGGQLALGNAAAQRARNNPF